MELLSLAGDLRQLDGSVMFGNFSMHAFAGDQLTCNVRRYFVHDRAGVVTPVTCGARGHFGAGDGHAWAVATTRVER